MTLILHRELEQLKRKILNLAAIVQDNLHMSMDAVNNRDLALVKKILLQELAIDRVEVEIEEDCLKVLALHQPVAIDLRFIVAVLKINSDLERIGDLAVNIAKRAVYLLQHEPVPAPFDLPGMYNTASWMLKASLDALVNLDPKLARDVVVADETVDRIHKQMYGEIRDAIRRRLDHLDPLTQYLTVSRFLERIADHATNIAEDVIYMVEGNIVRHQEPPDDEEE